MRDKESMEEGLLAKERDGFFGEKRFGELFVKEVKLLSYLAGPMVAVNLSHYFLQIISMMMVGHLGKLYLSSTAIAISFGAVSGFSLLVRFSFIFLYSCNNLAHTNCRFVKCLYFFKFSLLGGILSNVVYHVVSKYFR